MASSAGAEGQDDARCSDWEDSAVEVPRSMSVKLITGGGGTSPRGDSGVLYMDGPRQSFLPGVRGRSRVLWRSLAGTLAVWATVACCWGWDVGHRRGAAARQSGRAVELGRAGELYGRGEDLPVIASRRVDLAPLDVPLGMWCPNRSIVHYIPNLAGPWGLHVAMDGLLHEHGHQNLFNRHSVDERAQVRRVVVYIELNHKRNTFCKMRGLLNGQYGEHGRNCSDGSNGSHGCQVHVLTLRMPTRTVTPSHTRRCYPVWGVDMDWIANRPALPELSSGCHDQVLPTPCELLMGLVQRLKPPYFPHIENVRVMGFSAGAQLLDKCMYGIARSGRGLKLGGPDLRFLIVSPGALYYPVPERAELPEPERITCESFDPARVLNRTHKFRLPNERVADLAVLARTPRWACYTEGNETFEGQREECLRERNDSYRYTFSGGDDKLAPGCRGCSCCMQMKDATLQQENACDKYDKSRYGLEGDTHPGMPTGGTCFQDNCSDTVRDDLRRALLQHRTIYIAGSADVCNWWLHSRMSPQCGWCSAERTTYREGNPPFAKDILAPIVDSCQALWQGISRLERMKIYKDLVDKVVAPRLGISDEERRNKRRFYVLVGAGHTDTTAIKLLAGCLVNDDCDGPHMLPMQDLIGNVRHPSAEVREPTNF